MADRILATAVQVNQFPLFECPQTRELQCLGLEAREIAWMVPVTNMGIQTGWKKDLSTEKPSLDALRVIIAKEGSDTVYIAVADDDTITVLSTYCNTCCGETPDMTIGERSIVIPTPIVENTVCPTIPEGTPTYQFDFPLPYNPNSLKLTLPGGSFNAAYATPAYNSTGFSNPAALLAWVQANWAAYGDFTLVNSNKTLRLISETTTSADVNIDLVDAIYCLVLPETNVTVNGIMIGANLVTFPAITFSSATPGVLVNTLSNYLVGTLAVIDANNVNSPTKVQFTGQQVPVELYFDGDAVDDTAFTVGACPRVFDFAIPAQGNANNYLGIAATFNAVSGSPSPNAAGYATPALLLAFANGSWSAYGVWTLEDSDTTLRLTADPTVTAAVVTVTELAALYCMTVKAGPYNSDGIMVDGVQVLFGTPVTGITSVSYAGLITAIAAAMPTATVTDAGSSKVQISSKHIPTNLRQSAANVSAQTFALGAC